MNGRGRSWAYAGAFVGGVVSVAANIAHSFRPPAGQPATWTPQGGAVALAAFWPLALLLAIEVLVRVDWPRQRRWMLLRFGGVTPVAVVAAVVSYRHLSGLLDWYGEDAVTVAIGPLAVDGLMVISTGALLALASRSIEMLDSIAPVESIEPVESTAPESIESTPVELPVLDRVESSESIESSRPAPAIESTGGSIAGAGSGRVVALVPRAEESIESTEIEARPDDVAKLKAAIEAGEITFPPRNEPARKILKVGMPYVKAAIKKLREEDWTPSRDNEEITTGT